MIGTPERTEAAAYYYTYIDRVTDPNIVGRLETQLGESLRFLNAIAEEKSKYRYAPGKWSIREMWNHVNDTERVFLYRALWFARGFSSPLDSFDQEIAVRGAGGDEVSWASHVEEFRAIRLATLAFFRNLPADAWMRTGVASGNPFTVRALAYIIAGHVAHHEAVLKERYL
ncbi:MAG TPA: DinB family protein [Candidatus Acidoferrales bacterium]|nr:DinB family protein [Candidatus Acidoferrales bacterium]